MTKLIIAFCNFAKASKSQTVIVASVDKIRNVREAKHSWRDATSVTTKEHH